MANKKSILILVGGLILSLVSCKIKLENPTVNTTSSSNNNSSEVVSSSQGTSSSTSSSSSSLENNPHDNDITYNEYTKNMNTNTLGGMSFKILGTTQRHLPRIKDGGLDYYPTYNQTFASYKSYQADVLSENNLLLPSTSTFDSMDENGNLYLNGAKINQEFYAHSTSNNLYGCPPDEKENGVIKEITVYNPIKLGNYITGLYAPAGEIIKIEVSEEDLARVGGSFEIDIGQITSRTVINSIPVERDFTRMPTITSRYTINQPVSYVGSYFGGPIYVMPKTQTTFKMKISNALEYLHYIDGVTTKKEYDHLLTTSAPFFDFEIYGQEVRFNGPRIAITKEDEPDLSFDNVRKIMSFWHQCNILSRYMPHGANDLTSITMMFDTFIPMGAALAIVGRDYALLPISWGRGSLDYETFMKTGGWGTIHEFNHHFQKFGCNGNSNEVTNNVVNYMEYMMFTRITAIRDYENISHGLGLDSLKGINYYNEYLNTTTQLNTERGYGLLLQNFGVDVFKKFARLQNGQTTLQSFFDALSQATNMDLSYLFSSLWHMDMSDISEESLSLYSNKPKYVPIGSYLASSFKIGSLNDSNHALPYLCGNELDIDLKEDIKTITGYNVEIKNVSEITNGTLTPLGNDKYHYVSDNSSKVSVFQVEVNITQGTYKEEVLLTYKLDPNKNNTDFDYSLPNEVLFNQELTKSKKYDNTTFEVTSDDFVPWDNNFNLDKLFDNDNSTYLHSQRNVVISDTNSITLKIDAKENISFNNINFVAPAKSGNRNLPTNFEIYGSNDGENYTLLARGEDYTPSEGKVSFDFSSLISTRYLKIKVTKTSENYLGLANIEFNTNFTFMSNGNNSLKLYGDVNVISEESTFGHTYRLNKDSYAVFEMDDIDKLFASMDIHSSSYKIYINDEQVTLNKVLDLDTFDLYKYSKANKSHLKIKILVKDGYIDLENIFYK